VRPASLSELTSRGLSSLEIHNLQQLQRFLLSVTAKDVSLLLTFRAIKEADREEALHLPSIAVRRVRFGAKQSDRHRRTD